MINIETSTLINSMNQYMFSDENMQKGFHHHHRHITKPATKPATKPLDIPEQKNELKHQTINNSFIPFQKDKLFWCFYIILKGYDEYQMNHSTFFSVEKKIKIEAVEKLKTIKDKLKELKLKRTELEDELANKQTITIKGLYALCLIHDISITYVYGRKYCELVSNENGKKGVIVQNEKKEDTLRWCSNENKDSDNETIINDYLTKVKNEYWFISNIQKPLNAPSSYSSKELCDICEKLDITTEKKVNDKMKSKTKKQLYEEILEKL